MRFPIVCHHNVCNIIELETLLIAHTLDPERFASPSRIAHGAWDEAQLLQDLLVSPSISWQDTESRVSAESFRTTAFLLFCQPTVLLLELLILQMSLSC